MRHIPEIVRNQRLLDAVAASHGQACVSEDAIRPLPRRFRSSNSKDPDKVLPLLREFSG